MKIETHTLWTQLLGNLPLVAILRGVRPDEVIAVGEALQEAGLLCVEVPLNSPQALESIRKLQDRFGAAMLIGAGTVLTVAEVNAVHAAGARIVVSPNTNAEVIVTTKVLEMISLPGFATATEAFAAIHAGADALKLFPAEGVAPAMLKALRAVLPATLPVLPVGGINAENMSSYRLAGATGFGIGGSLYQPGMSALQVRTRAEQFVSAWRASG